jgi:hypothetical protein
MAAAFGVRMPRAIVSGLRTSSLIGTTNSGAAAASDADTASRGVRWAHSFCHARSFDAHAGECRRAWKPSRQSVRSRDSEGSGEPLNSLRSPLLDCDPPDTDEAKRLLTAARARGAQLGREWLLPTYRARIAELPEDNWEIPG